MGRALDDVQDSLRRLDGVAILDILLIASVIFALLTVLRGTAAMTLLRGAVAIVCGLFLLGQVLELTVVNFLLRNSLPGLVLGAIVIFQPEIRRALERAGRTNLRWRRASVTLTAMAEISKAVIELSDRRHGALIVIARGTGLEDILETGVHLDADVSAPLIASVFYPNSPMHDRALVVQRDRLAAASCTLPLSSTASSLTLGMRHRAAIGLTEQTDALVIVVSEETGAISVAAEGKLLQLQGDASFTATLTAALESHPLPRTAVSQAL